MRKLYAKRSLLILLTFAMLLSLLCFVGCDILKKNNEKEPAQNSPLEQADPKRDEFINTLGGVSDTYKGAVSVSSYMSAVDAAEAFVENEIIGEKNVSIDSTKSNGSLSKSEITALNIPAELQNGMTGVEEIEVTYTLFEDNGAATQKTASDTLNKTKKVKVYVIKYSTDWRYYSPCPINGDTITKSYYDSVFDVEKYKNCTMNSLSTIQIKTEGTGGYDIDTTMTVEQKIMYDNDKIYMEMTLLQNDLTSYLDGYSMCVYLEKVDGELVCYVKDAISGSEWMETELTTIGFSDINELTPFYDQYLDYTYFTKTSYGFAVSAENAKQYLLEAFEDADLDGVLNDDSTMEMYAEYFVTDGVLSGMRMDADVNLSINDYMLHEKITSTITCTNYGTTHVTKPFTE